MKREASSPMAVRLALLPSNRWLLKISADDR
jgi:hypothetical protein